MADESQPESGQKEVSASAVLDGRCVSPGVVHGCARVIEVESTLATARETQAAYPPAKERERYHAARARARAQLERVRRDLAGRGHPADAEIFGVHADMLDDPLLQQVIQRGILAEGRSAEAAVAEALLAEHDRFAGSASALLRERAADLLDIGQRMLRNLATASEAFEGVAEVVVAASLTPSELVRLVHRGATGFVLEQCPPRSHTAILARSLRVPLLAEVSQASQRIPNGEPVLVDASAHRVLVRPGRDDLREATDAASRPGSSPEVSAQPEPHPRTADGVSTDLLLNLSDSIELEGLEAGAVAGVGLFRTEFLYMDRTDWPSEEELFADYRMVASGLAGHELYIRLADFGADKCPSYAEIPMHRNPSLGVRGVRLLLQRGDLLVPQVRALTRLAAEAPVTCLLPMIDSPDTLDAAVQRLCRIVRCARADQLPFRIAAMIEVPAAALMIEPILARVDAVSIGLNDLVQYLYAADREDELVEIYHDALQPALLRVVREVVLAGLRAGKPVSVCGELAGDAALTGVLLGLGIRRFSVSRTDLAGSARVLRRADTAALEALVEELLALDTAAALRERLARAPRARS